MVVQGADPPLGLNEYYAECRFTTPSPELEAKAMVKAAPVAVGQGYLTVTTGSGATGSLEDGLP